MITGLFFTISPKKMIHINKKQLRYKKTNQDTGPEAIRFSEHTLENGLSVILSEDHSIPSVAINMCYHVGSKDEEPGKTGFAHLFEHLMFEGSANLSKGEYEKLTNRAGGDNNAYTTEDKTNYYLLLPSHQLELGLWLESDRMLECVVDNKSLETQKKVVIEEKKQNFDNRPYGSVSIEFAPRLFPGSGYSWDTIGNVEDIRNAKLEDVKSFFRKFYTPNNAVISITGCFEKDEALKLVKKYFGDIKKGPAALRNGKLKRHSPKEIKDSITDKIQFPGIFTAFRIPPENSKEYYAFDLLSEILSSGDSSRLYKTLVYEKQLASEVGCWADGKEHAGIFYLYVILLPGVESSDGANEIDKILGGLKTCGIEEKELQKAKNRIETKSYYRKQYILSKADMLAHYKTFYNNPGLINTNMDNYLTVTAGDIKNCIDKYIKNINRVTLVYLPEK